MCSKVRCAKPANRVRITGQLIDATTGAHLWADRFEGFLENIFELQDQVASGVVGAIDPKLLEAEMARVTRKPPANLDAYDCFLRASTYVYQWTDESLKRGSRYSTRPSNWTRTMPKPMPFAFHCYIWRDTARGLTEQERAKQARLAREAIRLGRDDAFSLELGWIFSRCGQRPNWKMARHFLIGPWRSIQIWHDRGT